MAKLRNKTFKRNSKRRISKKNTKKSKSRRRFRKFGGGYGEDDDPSLQKVIDILNKRLTNLRKIKLSEEDKKWGNNLTLTFIQQNAMNQQKSALDSYKQIITEIINEMKKQDENIDKMALVIYGDQTSDSKQKINNVILSQNVMSTM